MSLRPAFVISRPLVPREKLETQPRPLPSAVGGVAFRLCSRAVLHFTFPARRPLTEAIFDFMDNFPEPVTNFFDIVKTAGLAS